MHNKAIIESFPLQTYVAALLFSPSNSLVKDLFRHEESKRLTVKPSLTNDWSACLQTLDIDDGRSGNSILSHNSTRLATATNAGIRIWDVSSGTYLRTLRIQERGLCMAFSYDSGWLAVATDSTKWVDIWDVNRGACLMKLQGHLEDVTAVAFSQHQLASGSWDGTIKIWDPNSGACLRTIGTSSGLHTLGFSENRLLATRLGFFEVWDTHSCVCLSAHIMDGNYGRVVYSHDLTLLAVRWDSNIEIHHIDSGTCLQTLKSHGGWITSMAFSHDSSWVVSSSSDRAIRIWDVSSGACLQTFRSHSYRVVSLVGISHDSTRMVSASARRLEIWDTSSSTGSMSEPEQHTDTVCAMVFSRDSLLLATSSLDSTVKIWDSESGVCLQTLKGFDHLVCAIAFSYDSQKLVTGTYGRIVQIWSISDRGCASCLQTLHLAKDGNEYFCAALSADATQLLVGNYTGTVQVWNISTATCYRTFTVPDGRITCVALGGENNKLAYSIWDGKKSIVTILKVDSPWQQTFDMDKGPVHTLYFDNTCSYLHTEYGIVGHESRCLDLDINPDNKWVVHAGKNVLWIPTDCRSGEDSRHVCRSICGTRLAVSTETGKVWICTYTGQ
jgi:WD40 repeat protein